MGEVGHTWYIINHVCFKCLTPICLFKWIFIHTQVIKHYHLYRTLVGLNMYLSTHKAIKHYPPYRTLVGISVYLSIHVVTVLLHNSFSNTYLSSYNSDSIDYQCQRKAKVLWSINATTTGRNLRKLLKSIRSS